MRLKLLLLISLMLTSLPGAPGRQSKTATKKPGEKPAGQAAVDVSVPRVYVDVVVNDKDGNLLAGLRPEHFQVTEDGIPQTISNFYAADRPMTSVLLVEFSSLLPVELLNEARTFCIDFMRQMRPDDLVAVVAFDSLPKLLADFTSDRGRMAKSINALWHPGTSDSNLYDALGDTLSRLDQVQGRSVLVLISTGYDSFSKIRYKQIRDQVRASNCVIYCIALGGQLRARHESELSPETKLNLGHADATLREFAKLSGGKVFFPRYISEYPDILETITLRCRHTYTLAYQPANLQDGKWRKIAVTVTVDLNNDGKPDKVVTGHRQGYRTPAAGSSSAEEK